jgi:hypothetical protein
LNHDHSDKLQLASSTVTAYLNEKEIFSSIQWLGESASEFDVDMVALVSGAALTFNSCTDPTSLQITHITILFTSPMAIQAIQNLRAHPGQSHSLKFNKVLTHIFLSSRTIKIEVVWYLSNQDLQVQRSAMH